MDREDIKEEILKQAEKLLYYNDLLIEQCDGWLSAEEGNRNMEKRIAERRKMGECRGYASGHLNNKFS